ncbi:MAG: dihydrofolate reductase [Bacteroidales bacterium]|nr:dihydrofolate reductase [Bacteroidales bacterium]
MNCNNLSIIVAVDLRGAIGYKNNLLWHIPEDLKYFKSLTINNTVIMGKNTWLSLPVKPLPNRENIIISTSLKNIPNVLVFSTFSDALKYCCKKNNECFFIGGEKIYKQAINFVDNIYLTRILKEANHADAFFPLDSLRHFYLISEKKTFSENIQAYIAFEVYKRK